MKRKQVKKVETRNRLIEMRKPKKIYKEKTKHKQRFPTLNDLFFMAGKST